MNENQGGFHKNHLTISTVASFTDNLYNAINNSYFSLAAFIDFSKAFDTVNHSILITKLDRLGVRGKPLDLIFNFLKDCYQKTVVNNCGVPQRSLLGPLLFLIYINDLCEVVTACKAYLYADDTVLVTNAPDLITAHLQLQHDLNNVANWCKGNKLSINIRKN